MSNLSEIARELLKVLSSPSPVLLEGQLELFEREQEQTEKMPPQSGRQERNRDDNERG